MAPPRASFKPLWTRDWVVCLALFGLAVVVRLLFLKGTVDRDLPYSIFYYGDSRLYREFALAILRGESFDQGIPYHPPLLAYILAVVIRITGENPWALRAMVSLIGALAVPLTWLLGSRLWDRTVALVGALLATFSFGLCVAAVSPNTEAIYIPILLGQALALIALGDAIGPQEGAAGVATAPAPVQEARGAGGSPESRPPWSGRKVLGLSLVCGLLLGLGSLTRAEHLGVAALLPVALLIGWPRAGWRRVSAIWLVTVLAAGLVIVPWTVHNYLALGRFNRENPDLAEPLPAFVLVSNYGALNFALANNAGADGGFRPDLIVGRTGAASLDLKDPRQLRLYLHGYGEGMSFLAGNPVAAARLVWRKLAISTGAFSLGFGLSNWPSGLTGRRGPVDMFAPDAKWFVLVSIALLGAGIWMSRSLWRRASVIWLLCAHKALICVAFFGYVRLFVQLLPFLYLLQASALVAAVWSLAGRRRPAWRPARETDRAEPARTAASRPTVSGLSGLLGMALAALLVLELGMAVAKPLNFTAAGSSDGAGGKLLQDAEIRLAPKP